MSRLKDALLAGVPLISVTTDDPMHLRVIAEHHLNNPDMPVHEIDAQDFDLTDHHPPWGAGVVVVHCAGRVVSGREAHRKIEAYNLRSVVLVNAGDRVPEAYHAGAVAAPYDVVHDLVVDAAVEDPPAVLACLSGLSIKEVREVLMLAGLRYGELTPRAVLATRREYIATASGLDMVDPEPDPAYQTPPWLTALIEREGRFLKSENDWTLRPRGSILLGSPGTGKTSAAKALAHAWEVPLLRLDIGAVKQKYMGESEANLRAALSRAEAEAPCVLLIDEVEKALRHGGSDDSVTPALLAHLLWWLAEHRARIYVVMTTNDADQLPPELFREGRIDQLLITEGLTKAEARDFAEAVIWPYLPRIGEDEVEEVARAYADEVVKSLPFAGNDRESHARVVHAVRSRVKDAIAGDG